MAQARRVGEEMKKGVKISADVLIEQGILVKDVAGGRSTNYLLKGGDK